MADFFQVDMFVYVSVCLDVQSSMQMIRISTCMLVNVFLQSMQHCWSESVHAWHAHVVRRMHCSFELAGPFVF